MLGSVIRRKVAQAPAPRLRAAHSWSSPTSSRTGTTSRITRGSATKQVAMIMPGVAKMISMPLSSSVGPNQPKRGL